MNKYFQESIGNLRSIPPRPDKNCRYIIGDIFYSRDSAGFSLSAFNNLSCNLTDVVSKSTAKTYIQSVVVHFKKKNLNKRI